MKSSLFLILSVGAAAFLTSCSLNTTPPEVAEAAPPKAEYINPHPPGTYEHFLARLEYNKDLAVYQHPTAYDVASPSETRVVIDLGLLRGKLYDGNNTLILDYPIAPGTSEHPTPTGSFTITEKIIDKESNLYGKILDRNGVVVNDDADKRKDKIPPGGKFDGADMPYWMRLTNYGIGMHAGFVPTNPRRTASHGCIRHPLNAVQLVYAKTIIGTPVTIQ